MNYTKKLTDMNLTRQESKKLAEQIYDASWLMIEMSEKTIEFPDAEDEDFDEKLEQHTQQFNKHMAYSALNHCIFQFAHRQRRSWKMYRELDEAIIDAERLGLNIY